jgi:hypothetical protein
MRFYPTDLLQWVPILIPMPVNYLHRIDRKLFMAVRDPAGCPTVLVSVRMPLNPDCLMRPDEGGMERGSWVKRGLTLFSSRISLDMRGCDGLV